MRILVACETSGLVRDAFRALGHDAISCDILPTDVPGPHHQGDVCDILHEDWDMLVGHPPCTFVCGSGMHWTARGLRDPQLTLDGIKFAETLWAAPIQYICLENPIGVLSTQSKLGKSSQIIQPYEFGNDASKKTCLWLKGLPLLQSSTSRRIPGRWVEWPPGSGKRVERWANQTDSGQNKEPPSNDRWKVRSQTYPGIAQAMAHQWDSPALASHLSQSEFPMLFT